MQRTLYLTDTKIRHLFQVSRPDLVQADSRAAVAGGQEALPQSIGRLAWNAKWEGLLVPSAADHSGTNLLIFPGRLCVPGSYLVIVNRDQLPAHPAS